MSSLRWSPENLEMPTGRLASRAVQVVRIVVPWLFSLFLLYAIWRWLLLPHVSHVFLASPGQTWSAIKSLWSQGTLWPIAWTTIREATRGLAIGSVAGIVLALMIGLLPALFGSVVEPVVTGLYAMPKFVLAPVLFIWFGANLVPRTLLVALAVFPVMCIYTVTGIRTADPAAATMMRLNGASERQVAVKLLIPHARSYMGTAFVFAIPHAVTVAIAAEILLGATNGVGGTLNLDAGMFNASGVMAAVVIGTAICVCAMSIAHVLGARQGNKAEASVH
jgi:NitT/TauT family transport system permease protein